VAAAVALDDELESFEQLAREVARLPLDSQRSLERAAEVLRHAANADERLAERVGALVAAIAETRRRREAGAKIVQERATEIEQRSTTFAALLEKYRGIGSAASEITARLQALVQAAPAERETALADVRHRVAELAARAQELVKEADDSGFGDVARQADGLRQQLLAGLNKVSLVVKRLPS
jgi:chromosome segregation ATPase